MIIAITSTGKNLDSQIDSRFGRTQFIIFYNLNNSNFEVFDNKLNLNAPQGAGIQTAQNIVGKDVSAIISGNLGPKAFRVLNTAKIKAFSSTNTTVKEAVQSYKDGKLTELTNPNVEGHWV